ncbi:MAG: bifunctional hydroxymethylpyrimidine kinase/phosphomethylpyrimidine kinase [Eubacterium sp.]|nr:bifunctional hydroxymethylpyrimidine kinase/phosphomethylpyrimidine kinase [Eubacterium sp.]
MKKVLTIAGSDSSGGAGIQADIKTMLANGVYAMSVITALTAQNTIGVRSIYNVSEEFLKDQISSVFEDIYPDAVKIGMVSDAGLARMIAWELYMWKVKNVVLDPVMVSTSGARLISDEACEVLVEKLIPLARVITPNTPEAEFISGEKIKSACDMEKVAKLIAEKHKVAVLLKGGHSICDADDLLYENGKLKWFRGERINTDNTHGTGCVLSSAIASNLAKEMSLEEAITKAKEYISGALATGLDLGAGNGPLDHGFDLKSKFIST